MSSTNWINPAVQCFIIAKPLISFKDNDEELFNRVILYWQIADQSRSKPRELIRWFGEGLALFRALPAYIKDFEVGPSTSAFGVWILNALTEAMALANENRIAVTFGKNGPIFTDYSTLTTINSPDWIREALQAYFVKRPGIQVDTVDLMGISTLRQF